MVNFSEAIWSKVNLDFF